MDGVKNSSGRTKTGRVTLSGRFCGYNRNGLSRGVRLIVCGASRCLARPRDIGEVGRYGPTVERVRGWEGWIGVGVTVGGVIVIFCGSG